MRTIVRTIFHVAANAAALALAARFIPGVTVTEDIKALLILGAILTTLNIVIRPIVKLLAGPLILLTFGLFTVVVNALMLWLLDALSANLTMQGYLPLLLATLLVSTVNLVADSLGKATGVTQ